MIYIGKTSGIPTGNGIVEYNGKLVIEIPSAHLNVYALADLLVAAYEHGRLGETLTIRTNHTQVRECQA